MYALIQNNQITEVGELRTLFPGELQPNHLFAIQRGALPVVDGERKDERFYWVSFEQFVIESDRVLRVYSNTPKQLEDIEAVDVDGNPVYVQVWSASANKGKGAMVNSTERAIQTGLKTQYISQFKESANLHLSPTDWMVIRKAERNVDIPSEVVAKRAAILAECDRLIAAVTAAQDMTTFIAVVQSSNWN
jgi:uncharacterized protein YnzC (UPF0291/DUF896 family)